MTEGQFPKVDGDKLYASEINNILQAEIESSNFTIKPQSYHLVTADVTITLDETDFSEGQRFKISSTTTGNELSEDEDYTFYLNGSFSASVSLSKYRQYEVIYLGEQGTAWDVSTAAYSQNFDVSAQDTLPLGVFFKPDGTKMYVIGYVGKDVYEYNLSTAWDVSSAVYSQNFDVSAQETEPRGVFFKPDGTKMYVLGGSGRDVYEYNLSTAWDVSSADYSQNFDVNAQDTSPRDVFFKPDGTKMYVLGGSGRDVYEYNLSTAWDVSSADYSQNFDVSAQDIYPRGVFFKPDGTKMYVVGHVGKGVYEYNLSTAWDVSTAAYSQNLDVSAQDTYPRDVFFKPDGLKMYVIGRDGDSVYEYNLDYHLFSVEGGV